VEAKKLLDYLGLSERIHHKPNELSGGEQQRVAVARALINKPAVIFADEPSGNLDTHAAENLHQLFFKLRDEFGQTFVIVTHNEEFANMADRKLVMKDGLII
jgi:lipoprotein-releasing system ATP-binding protein